MHRLADLFQRLVEIIQPWAEQYGAGGLAVFALLDSSFLSLPQVADALLIGLTIAHPDRAALYAMATTAGSVAGSYVLFEVGRRGGQAFLRRRFKAHHVARGLALVERHGWLAITVPSLLPPPTPFKLFVILAGVAGLRAPSFIMAMFVGRVVRYGGEAWLAYEYGDRATAFLNDRLPVVLAVLAGLILAGAVGLVVLRRGNDGRHPLSPS